MCKRLGLVRVRRSKYPLLLLINQKATSPALNPAVPCVVSFTARVAIQPELSISPVSAFSLNCPYLQSQPSAWTVHISNLSLQQDLSISGISVFNLNCPYRESQASARFVHIWNLSLQLELSISRISTGIVHIANLKLNCPYRKSESSTWTVHIANLNLICPYRESESPTWTVHIVNLSPQPQLSISRISVFRLWKMSPTLVACCVTGAGIVQWLERRICDWKVAGSSPCRSGGRIFFSRVNFLCWLLLRYPFHPRVTAVARKRSRSFCQKCTWQVTDKHTCTLRV